MLSVRRGKLGRGQLIEPLPWPRLSLFGSDAVNAPHVETGAYVELLISASSSDPGALLEAYLPSGEGLGEVQNGGGGRYGGTVFITLSVPGSITIISSSGGSLTVPCVPYQP